jgi:hypothetical protein
MDAERIYEEMRSAQDYSGMLAVGTIVRWAEEKGGLGEVVNSDDWLPPSVDDAVENTGDSGVFMRNFEDYVEWCRKTGQRHYVSNEGDFWKLISTVDSEEFALESEKFLSLYEKEREPEFEGE